MNDIHTIQPSVNGINEVGLYLKKEAEPPFAVHIKKELDLLNAQWENICKQVCSLYPQSVSMLGVACSALSTFAAMCYLSRPMQRSQL